MTTGRILHAFKDVFLTQNKHPTLGRWNIHNHRQTILKITYANADNCGISGNVSKNATKIEKNDGLNDNRYIYMMGYDSTHN
jgi:hypothetical protein